MRLEVQILRGSDPFFHRSFENKSSRVLSEWDDLSACFCIVGLVSHFKTDSCSPTTNWNCVTALGNCWDDVGWKSNFSTVSFWSAHPSPGILMLMCLITVLPSGRPLWWLDVELILWLTAADGPGFSTSSLSFLAHVEIIQTLCLFNLFLPPFHLFSI